MARWLRLKSCVHMVSLLWWKYIRSVRELLCYLMLLFLCVTCCDFFRKSSVWYRRLRLISTLTPCFTWRVSATSKSFVVTLNQGREGVSVCVLVNVWYRYINSLIRWKKESSSINRKGLACLELFNLLYN